MLFQVLKIGIFNQRCIRFPRSELLLVVIHGFGCYAKLRYRPKSIYRLQHPGIEDNCKSIWSIEILFPLLVCRILMPSSLRIATRFPLR